MGTGPLPVKVALAPYGEDMAEKNDQIEMFPDFKVKDTSFVHFFRHVMESGKLAEVSGNAIKAYLVIKLNTTFSSGESVVPMNTLMDKTGIRSKATLTKALKELEDHHLLTVERENGIENKYMILEEFEASPESKDPIANIIIPYARGSIAKQIKNLPLQIVDQLKGKNIENLTINLVFQDNRTQIVNTNSVDDIENDMDVLGLWDQVEEKINRK